jgi:hypothetical protein
VGALRPPRTFGPRGCQCDDRHDGCNNDDCDDCTSSDHNKVTAHTHSHTGPHPRARVATGDSGTTQSLPRAYHTTIDEPATIAQPEGRFVDMELRVSCLFKPAVRVAMRRTGSRCMRAVVCDGVGGVEVMKVKDIPVPVPAPGELLVKGEAAGQTTAANDLKDCVNDGVNDRCLCGARSCLRWCERP